MTSISLREYHSDIEKMIEGGQVNEAIAHCQHILRSYPLNLDTYRFLGKAYLESRKYREAADIFQRILSSVPDDFVSNVGMSIIRDNEKNLNDSIWHMERAFEVQPSNSAIQEELRKLYGRRDGVEPTKVRLTRDALANMYAQGALYSQAIAEIRSVLAEDPNRPDLKVMLAKAYSKDGRKKQSIEICTELLKEYPYCFDALRIMVDLLSSVENKQLVSGYRSRINALDPYAEFVTKSIFDTEDVADDLVKIVFLKAIADSSKEATVPDWIPGLGENERGFEGRTNSQIIADSQQPDRVEENSSKPDSTLEDLLNNLQTENLQSDIRGKMNDTEPLPSNDELSDEIKPNAHAEIPDWIKELAPDDLDENSEDNIASEEVAPKLGLEKDLGEILQTSESTTTEKQEVDSSDDIPGWLKDLGTDELFKAEEQEILSIDSGPSDDLGFSSSEQTVPDWLTESQAEDSLEQASQEIDEYDLPDWLKGFETEKAMDTLLHVDGFEPSLGGKEENTIEEMSKQPEPVFSSDSNNKDGNNIGSIDESIIETGDLDRLSDESSLDRLFESSDTQSEVDTPEIKTEHPDPPEAVSIDQEKLPEQQIGDLNDADAAFAWLESLAARQGANPDELSTKLDSMDTEPPEWIKNALGENSESIEVTPFRDNDAKDNSQEKDLISDWSPTSGDEEGSDVAQDLKGQLHESPIKDPEIMELPEDDIFSLDGPDNQEDDEEEFSISAKELESRSFGDEWVPSIQSEEDAQVEEKEQEVKSILDEGEIEITTEIEEEIENIVQPVFSGDWKPVEETDLELESEEIQTQQPDFIASNEEVSQLNKVPASGTLTRKPVKDLEKEEEILEEAQQFIEHRDLQKALDEYRKLIKKGKLLEGVIHDLKEISYQFPVDVSVWQSLGDAYMRANQLQDALDSYTKAEELLR